jgi:hypothetical protein
MKKWAANVLVSNDESLFLTMLENSFSILELNYEKSQNSIISLSISIVWIIRYLTLSWSDKNIHCCIHSTFINWIKQIVLKSRQMGTAESEQILKLYRVNGHTWMNDTESLVLWLTFRGFLLLMSAHVNSIQLNNRLPQWANYSPHSQRKIVREAWTKIRWSLRRMLSRKYNLQIPRLMQLSQQYRISVFEATFGFWVGVPLRWMGLSKGGSRELKDRIIVHSVR